MTNWIIGHTDRFCCAATQRSISNWVSFYGTSDIGILFGEYQTDATVFDDPEKMWEQSPLKYAKNFVTPTLIIHSDCDYRCPISEGFQLYTALKERGVDSRMVIFKGENHDLSRTGKPLHRVRRLEEISKWFEKYAK
ncbi:MAG: prolyl oligopeptidase family serine peptidase, partial [Candidatus Faecivicinus sp.]|nr:prolyl oligopeptidase family serine peptidase [Candidatus Faecivicinus sp.]